MRRYQQLYDRHVCSRYLSHTGSSVRSANGATARSSHRSHLVAHVYPAYAPAYSVTSLPTTSQLKGFPSTSLPIPLAVLPVASLLTPVPNRLHTPPPLPQSPAWSTAKRVGPARGGDPGLSGASSVPTFSASC